MVFLVPLQAENCALYVGLHRKVNDEHSFNERINWQIDRRIMNLVFFILEKNNMVRKSKFSRLYFVVGSLPIF